jgi:arylsulfatase A-like enzyme
MNTKKVRKLSLLVTFYSPIIFFPDFAFAQSRYENPARKSSSNVIFIIADDLNDALGFMGGHPQSYTPNIDRLARRGVTFSKAYTNCPLCNPSRASLWTGIAPWVSNVYGNNGDGKTSHWRANKILGEAVTMQEHFKANGYDIFGTGKVFHDYSKDNLPGVWTDHGNRIGFYPTPGKGGKNNPRCGHPSMPVPLNQDLWLSCGPLSDVPDVPPDSKAGTPGYKGWTMGNGIPFRYVNENDRDLMPDELSANYIKELLKKDHDKPFLAICGFFRPHEPLYAPKKYFDLFPMDEIVLPVTIKNDLEDVPEILWNDPDAYNSIWKHERFKRLIDAGGIDMWKRWVQAYLACCAFVDDQVGKVLDALDSSQYAGNTIVVLTSDHGYNMGEKETLFKYTLWEESARVPLIISAPGMKKQHPGECTKPVSLIDLYPTLTDMCNLPPDPNKNTNKKLLDGYSLKSLLTDPSGNDWLGPAAVITVIANRDPAAPLSEQHISVRSERWRYTLCANGEEELYDHLYDPDEWTNLALKDEYKDIKNQHNRYVSGLLQNVSKN